MKNPLSFISVALLLLMPVALLASDTYFAATSAGSNNGTSCANAYAYNDGTHGLGVVGTWASDANLHLCSTFSASAGASSYIQAKASGTSGHPITLIFETGATITATYWSGAAIDLNGKNYITVNGNNTGTIQATANGTGLANQQDNGIGVNSGSAASNDIVENLTISNLYVHTCTLPIGNCTDEGGQNVYGVRIIGGSNDTITGNTIHDTKWAILFGYVSSTGVVISNNTIYNMDHGPTFGDAGASDTGTGSIFGNDISSMQNWDDNADTNHHDGIHTWANNTGSSYTLNVYGNYFHGDGGVHFNAWIGIEAASVNSNFYNNLVVSGRDCSGGVGLIGLFSGGGPHGSGNSILNNTINGNGTNDGCEGIGVQEQSGGTIIENNVTQNVGTFIYIPTAGQVSTIDYNSWYTSTNGFWCPSHVDVNFATWKASCGYDASGLNSNPNLNGSYIPNVVSPVIGAGTNLTSLGISTLDSDKNSVARPSSAAWDIGAYQYVAPPISAPGAGGAATFSWDVREWLDRLVATWVPAYEKGII